MRVLFVTYPGPSHYFPMVALASAMWSAGHEVLVATQPSFATDVTRTGLSAVPVGPDVDTASMFRASFNTRLRQAGRLPNAWPDTVEELRAAGLLSGVLDGLRHFAELADLMADELLEFGRHWRPKLVVYAPTAFAGAVSARVLGIPAVRHLWGPDFFHWIDELEAEPLAPLATRFGLDAVGVAGTLVVDPAPCALQAPYRTARQSIRCVPYNGAEIMPSWLRHKPDRLRVCVTWGTWIRDMRLSHLFRVPEVVSALSDMDVEVVVTATAAERVLLPDLPRNARTVDPVPLHLLLPDCAAVVHQGGTGTMMTALAYGVPQLVVPQTPDQLFNAGRLATTGAGCYLPAAAASTEAIGTWLTNLLDATGRYRARAEELRAEMAAQPAPAEVVEILEKLDK